MEQVTEILNVIVSLVPVLLQIVGGVALIATMTPNKVDDKILQVLMDVINFIGANFGKAKNADPNA